MTAMTFDKRSTATKRRGYASYARFGYISIAATSGLFGLWAATAPSGAIEKTAELLSIQYVWLSPIETVLRCRRSMMQVKAGWTTGFAFTPSLRRSNPPPTTANPEASDMLRMQRKLKRSNRSFR